MKLKDFLHQTNMDDSLLIGYYGGGNYGDELLLEVLSNLLANEGVHNLTVTYQRPRTYRKMHRNFGFKLVDIHDRAAVFKAAIRSKKIVIGGGGLWGVDMNVNTLLLSLFLFVSRWALRKKIYLLGVGYYNSTPWMGRLGAWLAGKAANVIFARDDETAQNFERLSKHVYQDTDIAWYTKDLNLSQYQPKVELMEKNLPVGGKTLLVALRRPQSKRQRHDFIRFNKLVRRLIQSNPSRPIILLMLESEAKDAEMYQEARNLRRNHKHLRIIEVPYNPLTLFSFVKKHYRHLALIAPQLHMIMTAHLAGVPFMPLTYDNKVSQLMDQIGIPPKDRLHIKEISGGDLLQYANDFYGGEQQ